MKEHYQPIAHLFSDANIGIGDKLELLVTDVDGVVKGVVSPGFLLGFQEVILQYLERG